MFVKKRFFLAFWIRVKVLFFFVTFMLRFVTLCYAFIFKSVTCFFA